MTLYKRSRGNDGTAMHATRAVPVRQTLIYAVLGESKREERAPSVYHGPKPARKGPTTISDAQVLRVRALRKFACWPWERITSDTGLSVDTVKSLCEYRTRVHLEPTEKDAA